MLADDGREASATGFMKAQLNGDIILATEDGAIPESVIFAGREKPGQSPNGFEVPYVNGHPTADGLVRALKSLAQALKTPAKQAAMIRAALSAEPQVSINGRSKRRAPFTNVSLASPNICPFRPPLKTHRQFNVIFCMSFLHPRSILG